MRTRASSPRGCRRRSKCFGGKQVEVQYTVTPTRRGEVVFEPADVHVRSRFGFCELLERLGPREERRVFPDFQQVARYAWLAGDRRLRKSASRPISSAARVPTSSSSRSIATAIRCGTSTGRRRFAWASPSSASFRTSVISACCCSSIAAVACVRTIARARSARRTSIRC